MEGAIEFMTEGDQPSFRPVVYWYPSFRCNLACKHCWVNSSPTVDTSRDLRGADALKVVEQIAELEADKVIFSGGEALFWPDILVVFRALLECGIRVGFETNGLLFSKEFTDLVKWGQARGVNVGMTVSLDGGTARTHNFLRGSHTFERTLKGMHFLKEEGVRFDAQCVVNSMNIESIPDLFGVARTLLPALGRLAFAFLQPVGRGHDLVRALGMGAADYKKAYRFIGEGMSGFGGHVVVKVPPAMIPPEYMPTLFAREDRADCVTSCAFPTLGILNDGSISICALTRDDPAVRFGNVRTHRLLDVWKKARMDIVRQKYLGANLSGICADCRFRAACKGACRAFAYEEAGSFDAAHPLCAALEERGEFPEIYRVSHERRSTGKKHLPVIGSSI